MLIIFPLFAECSTNELSDTEIAEIRSFMSNCYLLGEENLMLQDKYSIASNIMLLEDTQHKQTVRKHYIIESLLIVVAVVLAIL